MNARRSAVAVAHACVLPHSVNLEGPVLVRDAVDVHRAVAALRCKILIQGVPRDTLHIVVVLSDLVHALAWVTCCQP